MDGCVDGWMKSHKMKPFVSSVLFSFTKTVIDLGNEATSTAVNYPITLRLLTNTTSRCYRRVQTTVIANCLTVIVSNKPVRGNADFDDTGSE